MRMRWLAMNCPEAPPGKNTFKLIGVGEFNLPAYRDHTVLVKALQL